MKFDKLLVCLILLCVVVITLAGCRNNLVNEWENYSGDTDVYYKDSNVTTFPESVCDDTMESTEDVVEYGIPDYWADELSAAVKESDEALNNADGNSTAFIWYNDSHLSYSARCSVPIIKFLQDHTNVQYVNFGGDIVSDNEAVEHSEIISQLYDWRKATLALSNHHSVVGNHDDDIEEFADRQDLYNFLLKDEDGKTTDENNSFCYYVDNSEEKTRFIYLSTGFDETTDNDIKFLVNTLKSTQSDWHIVVVSHIWFVYNSTLTPTEGTVPEFAQVIFNVLDDYNNRTTGISKGTKYDFSSVKAKVEFCIGGHTHVDYEFYTDGGIPVILNETDSYHLRGGDKGIDETDEASVSVIVADYGKNIIRIVRAGRGESRTVSMLNN